MATEGLKQEEIAIAAWNVAQGFVLEIQASLKMATHYYNRDDFFAAFKCLHATRMRIVQYLSETERETLKAMEKNLRELLGKQTSIEDPEDHHALWNKLSHQIYYAYGDYNDLLMDLIKKYHLGIPDKETDEGMF